MVPLNARRVAVKFDSFKIAGVVGETFIVLRILLIVVCNESLRALNCKVNGPQRHNFSGIITLCYNAGINAAIGDL